MSRVWVWVAAAAVLAIALAGCKRTPAYVGNYTMGLFDQQGKKDAGKSDAFQEKTQAALSEVTLTVDADGTFKMHFPALNAQTPARDDKGTYTVEGDKLTLVEPGSPKEVWTFHEAEHTLTSGTGDQSHFMVFKKKK